MDLPETLNMDYIDAQYRLWKDDPEAVPRDWRFFFRGFETAAGAAPAPPGEDPHEAAVRQSRVDALIHRHRDLGHLLSCLDPLAACPSAHPLLDLEAFDLEPRDLEREFFSHGLTGSSRAPLKEILKALRETYCRAVGVEYMHLQDPGERRWLQARMEPARNRPDPEGPLRLDILRKICRAARFEQFLHRQYAGQTRFSLEGAEALIPLLGTLVQAAADHGGREIILGTAHRGRLNIQAHVLEKPYADIFGEFEYCHDPEHYVGAGDVKYHNGYLADLASGGGRRLRILLMSNPSHLESVDPVVEGFARARQEMQAADGFRRVVPLLIHGDAAFAGQGIVAETLNMSQLDGYGTGGTLHVIINNQIGYTTLPEDARSSRYSTDVAKMIMVPIFHVHGEDPDAVVHAARLAADYRAAFGKDVVIDLVCYRRHGHNEGDEPYFTQPRMYDRIRDRPPVYRVYAQELIGAGLLTEGDLARMEERIDGELQGAHREALEGTCRLVDRGFFENWEGYHGHYSHDPFDSGVAQAALVDLARRLNRVPEGFNLHPKLKRLLDKRLDCVEKGAGIDWANAESLAFATLLAEGHPVRLSGQDSQRGTFSQRHSVLSDTQSGGHFAPLSHLSAGQAAFGVHNSLLSEAGVLGFEYGYAAAQPRGLTLWEAQFGDFVNNAQAAFDLYIASGEAKWQRLNGLVLLLPHGWEGLGPEHSSARLERFLQLCAGDNIQVCNATTPAQYFHLLRRQALRSVRKPLVVMAPKSLLRHPLAVSSLEELVSGRFREVLDDPLPLEAPERVLFCSGKIFFDLHQRREALGKSDIALVRLEQCYPFPYAQVEALLGNYRDIRQWCWVQEEPVNMGAGGFVLPRLENLIGRPVRLVGRKASASPATGFPPVYRREQADIVEQAVGPPGAAQG